MNVSTAECPTIIYLHHVSLDAWGRDTAGRQFGLGSALWFFCDGGSTSAMNGFDGYCRARTRMQAEAHIRELARPHAIEFSR